MARSTARTRRGASRWPRRPRICLSQESRRSSRNATSYKSLAAAVAQIAPGCVLIAADTESGAVLLTTEIAAAMPEVKIFGTADLAESTYSDPEQGGIPLSVDPRVVLTSPTLGLSEYPPSARAFNAAYRRRYGPPQPAAIFGYEAMSLLLSAIERATEHGTRPAVRSEVQGRAVRHR